MKSNIDNNNLEITVDMLNQMNELRVTDGRMEDIIDSEKGSRVAGEALYYLSTDWNDKNLKYEQDHLHPDDRFDKSKPNKISVEEWKEWKGNKNRLPNLQLFEGVNNAKKSNIPLIDYVDSMNNTEKTEFLDHALIPQDLSLEFEDFGNFYNKRKEIIIDKLKTLFG